MNERDIFIAALQINDNLQRVAYLDEACAGDANLRGRVDVLLGALNDAGSYLEQPAVEPVATIDQPITEKPGTQIGPYKLREKIGEGGMGEVYVAEQTAPVRRKVALKIIKPGMASKDVVARFEAERQALAMMDHPNIASVLDGGATENGQPFFVMELVRGVPISEYCDRKRLPTTERLQLFIKICRAVQHAHQKGIIHRDIKPTNVLVPEIDGEAVPKVIDFGVAKAVSQKLTDQTVYTHFEQVVGTPLYMSPEQAGTGVVDIDTRSDVYSLGVLLYELLTGNTPFDRETLKQSGFDEFRRILREEEPRRPSQAISTLNAEAMSTISDRRACDPRKLMQTVRGELDWIVMKALEKDRSRRYETANGLARDIERYLNSEPVEACPPSAIYRFKKFAKRNRGKFLAASLAGIALLIAAGSLAAWKWDQNRKQRQFAFEVERWTFAARAAMEGGDLEMAEKQLAAARVLAESAGPMLTSMNNAISELEGNIQERQQQQERFARFLDLSDIFWTNTGDLADSEALQALELYDVLGDEKWTEKLNSSYLEEAQKVLLRERAYEILLQLASVDPWERNDESVQKCMRFLDVAAAFHEPTRSYYRLRQECFAFLKQWDRKKEFEELYNNAPATTVFDHFLTGQRAGQSDDGLQAAIRHYEKALEIQPDNFRALFFLAYRLGQLERYRESAQAYRGCLALRPDHMSTLCNLATVLADLGQFDQALALANRAIDLHPNRKWPWQARGRVYLDKDEYRDAKDDFSKAIGVDADFASAYNNRGIAFQHLGEVDRALADFEKAIRLAPRDPDAYYNRAQLFHEKADYKEAIADFDAVIELRPTDAKAWGRRGLCYFGLGEVGRAREDCDRAVELDPNWPGGYHNRGVIYTRLGEYNQALSDFCKALEMYGEEETASLVNLYVARSYCYATQGQFDQAEVDLDKALALQPKREDLYCHRGWVRGMQEDYAGAIESFERAVEIAPTKLQPYLEQTTFRAYCPDPKFSDPPTTLALAQKAVELDAVCGDAWIALGFAQYRVGECSKAITSVSKGLNLKPDEKAVGYLILALAHQKLGHRESAIESYDRAVRWIDSSNAAEKLVAGKTLVPLRHEAAAAIGLNSESGKSLPEAGDENVEIDR